jgi:phosphatidylethanolamine/phosphatidyl-N-methylethanolamine N-methyltransferase
MAGAQNEEGLKPEMQLLARLNATTLFCLEAIFRPHQIGAVLPSGRPLARAMARWLPPDPDAYALELGPGTGSVTEALFEHGLREDRLIAIEKSEKMADLLRHRFPKAKIITGDAFQLDQTLRRHARQADKIGAVFCSLPLRNFRAAVADELAKKIRHLLPSGGRLIQYTYRIASTPPRASHHFQRVASDVVWFNIPPARVSVYQK